MKQWHFILLLLVLAVAAAAYKSCDGFGLLD